jgi:hypothetical protein
MQLIGVNIVPSRDLTDHRVGRARSRVDGRLSFCFVRLCVSEERFVTSGLFYVKFVLALPKSDIAGARAADADPHLRGVAASRLRGRLRRCSPVCAALGRAARIPLTFAPGEAYQFDWSQEIVVMDGVTTTVKVAPRLAVRLARLRHLDDRHVGAVQGRG